MELQLIRQQLHNRYIEPTKPERPKYIGVEIEIPVVNLSKNAVDFAVIHKVTNRFIAHFEFLVTGTDDDAFSPLPRIRHFFECVTGTPRVN